MLAENLVDAYKPVQQCTTQDQVITNKEVDENYVNEPPEFDFGE